MVSTPARSSAATRISLPCIVGPTSARSRVFVVFGSVVVLLIFRPALWPEIAGKQKPTTVASRGFLSKLPYARQVPPASPDTTTTTSIRTCSAVEFIRVKTKRAAAGRSSADSNGLAARIRRRLTPVPPLPQADRAPWMTAIMRMLRITLHPSRGQSLLSPSRGDGWERTASALPPISLALARVV